jgi:Icc-related predicted phosphoesterase
MVSTIAVLSDVHGVLPVLEAVLAEPDVAAADLVVVCGDLAAGPMPVETLNALTALGSRWPWRAAGPASTPSRSGPVHS